MSRGKACEVFHTNHRMLYRTTRYWRTPQHEIIRGKIFRLRLQASHERTLPNPTPDAVQHHTVLKARPASNRPRPISQALWHASENPTLNSPAKSCPVSSRSENAIKSPGRRLLPQTSRFWNGSGRLPFQNATLHGPVSPQN